MSKTCSLCGEVLIHIAPGVWACYSDDLVGRFPIYIEVKGETAQVAYLGGYAAGYDDVLFDFEIALDESDFYTVAVSETWP